MGRKWRAQLSLKGKIQKHGGIFKNELEAAIKVNQLCEEMEIPLQNPGISAIPTQQCQKKEKTSQYKGVHKHKKSGKWYARLILKGATEKFGGTYNDEMDAVKRVNQLCEEMDIPLRNPEISAIPTPQYQKKKKTSKYKGVHWNKENGQWRVQLTVKGQNQNGGHFKEELDAAKKVNQLCEKLEAPLRNPGINAVPSQQYQKGGKTTSQYKGVHWHKQIGKWYAHLLLDAGKQKFGGVFIDEMDAAKRVNQLCEEMGIPLRNPGISAIPSQQYQKKKKTSQYKGVHWSKENRQWRAELQFKKQKQNGGYFKEELDAAKKVNQLCEKLEIPLRNHGVPGETPIHTSEIPKIDNDDHGESNKKRKRKQKIHWEEQYFYEHFLK